MSAMSVDDCKGEIFQLYIVERKRLKDVMTIIEERYSITTTAAVYKARLEKWGYSKNTKRCIVNKVVEEQQIRDSEGKATTFFLHDRPLNLEQVNKYRERERITHTKQLLSSARIQHPVVQDHSQTLEDLSMLHSKSRGLTIKTPPRPPLQNPLVLPQIWLVPEKLMYHIDIYIKGSFEHGTWHFIHNERLITSSPTQNIEQASIMSFLDGLDTGSRYFNQHQPDIGGLYWRKAFREIETLVTGSYHGIIPNIVFKVNDLLDGGFEDAARMLLRYAAQCCGKMLTEGDVRAKIFGALAEMDVNGFRELELGIMTCFLRLFEMYVGKRCYNTFVMEMDLARRRILRGEEVERCLPRVEELDVLYGTLNHRSLDAIRLRMEFWFARKEYVDVERLARMLIERASTVEGDAWRKFYFLFKGEYHLGLTQYDIGDYGFATQTFRRCLEWDAELGQVDDTGQFNTEKVDILERLERMACWNGEVSTAITWQFEKMQVLDQIKAADLLYM